MSAESFRRLRLVQERNARHADKDAPLAAPCATAKRKIEKLKEELALAKLEDFNETRRER